MPMRTIRFRAPLQNFGEFPVECGIVTGIIFGKVLVDYLVSQSISIFFISVSSVFVLSNLIIFSFCNKTQNATCKE